MHRLTLQEPSRVAATSRDHAYGLMEESDKAGRTGRPHQFLQPIPQGTVWTCSTSILARFFLPAVFRLEGKERLEAFTVTSSFCSRLPFSLTALNTY